ncbi:aldehyde dehydrogenase family protein [Oscillibacter sp.]|jgi:propionaldehyde dehydrogenase|uniref:aldehyde dehydrogenase family protein n=1 Tax=Oscillibacter sp. TaxID=1945593 RepID=UPI00216E12BB|nr:aldehyde dehydrogenase family protein [Oscillibacter sp.]MCI9648267.1 aldehyde dehydrogenase EutE [Oscillibacter sp.]
MNYDEKAIERIVDLVTQELRKTGGDSHGEAVAKASGVLRQPADCGKGIYEDVNEAVEAAWAAQKELMRLSLKDRKRITDAIIEHCAPHIEELAKMELEETGMGNYKDKLTKLRACLYMTPSVEKLDPDYEAGDNGAALYEYAPFGVIGALTPSTNPPETVINNSIVMIAAGNTVVFSTHPNAYNSSARAVQLVTEAIRKAGGPDNLIVSIAGPTVEKTNAMMNHPKVNMLCATGGPGVVRSILSCGKKGIGAGAGNPPAFVDETADIEKAAKDIVNGASYDNNIPCIAEKAVVVVNSAADRLISNMTRNGAYLIRDGGVIKKLTEFCMPKEDSPNKKMIGKSPAYILSQIGVKIPEETRVAIFEAPRDNMLVMNEQMMPVLPIVRVKNTEEGIDLACDIEHGRRHTATCHSKNLDVITEYAKRLQCTIIVANGSSFCAMGIGGVGHNALTIAGPTGEGLTNPKVFTRKRKIVLVDGLNIRAGVR